MKVVRIRKRAKTSQQVMAQEVGVSVKTISNWETAGKHLSDLRPLVRKAVEDYALSHNVKLQ